MKVSQLIAILQNLPSDAMVELPDGVSLDDVYFHGGMNRVSFDTENNRPTEVTQGWQIIELTSPSIVSENQNFYVTFSQSDAINCDKYTLIEAPSMQKARQITKRVYGTKFAFIYDEEHWKIKIGDNTFITQDAKYNLILREKLSA